MIEAINDKCNQLFNKFAILSAESIGSADVERWRNWLFAGRNATLRYMTRERHDLRVVMPTVRTVVVGAVSYKAAEPKDGMARYASTGVDYHVAIKERMYQLLATIRDIYPDVKGRAVVDTAPAMEKAWAVRGGIGWVGRNSLVVDPDHGSYFNIGLLLLDIELPEVKAERVVDGCGGCRRCIDSCPMGAIGEDRMIDARSCISYLTVERLRLEGVASEIHGWRCGCDVCQECCPWNQ